MKKLSEVAKNMVIAAEEVEIDWNKFNNLVPAPSTLPDQEGVELTSLGLIVPNKTTTKQGSNLEFISIVAVCKGKQVRVNIDQTTEWFKSKDSAAYADCYRNGRYNSFTNLRKQA